MTDAMKLGRLTARAIATALAIAAAPPDAGSAAEPNTAMAPTPQGGRLLGSPEAPAKLVIYLSYTCPHCARFEREAEAALRLNFVAGGKGSVEYRSFIRNKIDIAATLLANCGPANRFWGNHAALMRSQDKWFRGPNQTEDQRWSSNDFPTAMRAIAGDLKLYDLMQNRGYTRAQLDRCLTDRQAADKLAVQTQFALNELNVRATPSFIVNGEVLRVHDWQGLRPRLMELTR
jgi:protein-disulfide isomerase